MNSTLTFLRQSGFGKYALIGGLVLCVVLCLWGAASDRAYKKAGGVRPTADAKLFLVATIAVSLSFLVALFIGKHARGIVGGFAAILSVFVFGAWEILRLRVRRKYPIRK